MEKENIKPSGKPSRVWIGEDNIIYVTIGGPVQEHDIWEAFDDVERALSSFEGKGRAFVNMTFIPIIQSSQFRKAMADRLKKMINDPGFLKAAICGGGVAVRTVTSFLIAASGLDNIKMFDSEKKAMEWLKK